VKQVFSRSSILSLAFDGALFGGGSARPGTPGRPEAPPLNLQYVAVTVPFAQIRPDSEDGAAIELLPRRRLNDRILIGCRRWGR
jgi:hypothetical protein